MLWTREVRLQSRSVEAPDQLREAGHVMHRLGTSYGYGVGTLLLLLSNGKQASFARDR